MRPDELLTYLRAAGCVLEVEGDALRVRDLNRVLNDELRGAIRRHKPELLAMLGACRFSGSQESRTNAAELVAAVQRRGLATFRSARFPGDLVALAADKNAAQAAPPGAVVYLLDELARLAGMGREDIAFLHETKRTFGPEAFVGGLLTLDAGGDGPARTADPGTLAVLPTGTSRQRDISEVVHSEKDAQRLVELGQFDRKRAIGAEGGERHEPICSDPRGTGNRLADFGSR